MLPSPSTSFHACSHGGVVFDDSQRKLFALNPTASAAWLSLDEPEPSQVMARSLGIDPALATKWFETSVAEFRRLGLIGSPRVAAPASSATTLLPSCLPPVKPRCRLWPRHRVLDLEFRLRAPSHVRRLLEGLLASLRLPDEHPPRGDAVAIEIEGEGGYAIRANGIEIGNALPSERIAPELERFLVTVAVNRTPHLITLHAGVVSRGGRGLILAGSSGSGKTTLAVALSQDGWQFGSDELALLMRDGRIRPAPLGACIKPDSFALVTKSFPSFRDEPVHDRFGREVRYLALASSDTEILSAYVVFPSFNPDGDNALERIEGLSGLQRLLEHCLFVPASFAREDVRPAPAVA